MKLTSIKRRIRKRKKKTGDSAACNATTNQTRFFAMYSKCARSYSSNATSAPIPHPPHDRYWSSEDQWLNGREWEKKDGDWKDTDKSRHS